MYLSNIKLWNFRKFGSELDFDIEKPNLNLEFTDTINVLIGENDSGKTAIIDAIKLVLKTHSFEWLRITQDDFYKESNRLRIELLFSGLSDDEAKNFIEWLGWNGEGENAKPYLRLIYDVKRNIEDNYILPSEVRAGVDETGYTLTAEAKEYLKVTYLKPLRDAYAELVPKRNSRLSQILLGHEAFKGKEENHLLVELFREFNKSVEKYFEGKSKDDEKIGDQRGKELKEKVDNFIHSFYSKEKQSNFSVIGENLKNILEKLELTIKDDINPGLGSLNRLFMAAELVHLQKKNWTGLRLGLIEELEAHIHPQAQMQIIEYLQKEKNIQLILTTHSPNLGSKVKLKNLILCANHNAFPMGQEYTKLNNEDYEFLERFLDTTKANMLFAKGIILVEGWAEEILLPAVAKKLKAQNIIRNNLTEAGVSIVNVGSTAFLRYSKIYLRKNEPFLDIPVAIITDVDLPEYEKVKDKIIKNVITEENKNKEIQKLKEKYEEQKVKVFVAPDWTLEYSLFKSQSLTNKFQKAAKEIHSGTNWETNFEEELAKKLINKDLKKTEIAYQLAQEIELDNAIRIDENDADIQYLIDAIKYVCKN